MTPRNDLTQLAMTFNDANNTIALLDSVGAADRRPDPSAGCFIAFIQPGAPVQYNDGLLTDLVSFHG